MHYRRQSEKNKFGGGVFKAVMEYNGNIKVYSDEEIKTFYPLRKRNTHKGNYGSANLIAGCGKYLGAAVLSAEAALRSGCGYVKLTADESVKSALAFKIPQVIFLGQPDLSSQAIAVGMGCGVSVQLYEIIQSLLSDYEGTLIIDADAINSLAKYGKEILKNNNGKVILTPHAKEFSRLTGLSIQEITKDPLNCARAFAKEYSCIILLKGADSVITDVSRTVVNTRGTTALAKGGSGDMLSGYMCGCAARGLQPFDSAVCAAYTLGLSAEISSEQKTDYCATAKDILNNLHFAVKRLTD